MHKTERLWLKPGFITLTNKFMVQVLFQTSLHWQKMASKFKNVYVCGLSWIQTLTFRTHLIIVGAQHSPQWQPDRLLQSGLLIPTGKGSTFSGESLCVWALQGWLRLVYGFLCYREVRMLRCVGGEIFWLGVCLAGKLISLDKQPEPVILALSFSGLSPI